MRQLLAVEVAAIPGPTEGLRFDGQIATFPPGEVAGEEASDFSATIDWGDGSMPSPGTIVPVEGAGFSVVGSHVYEQQGDRVVTVAISGLVESTSSGQGAVQVSATKPTGIPRFFEAAEGVPLEQIVVASFTDLNPFESASDFEARIAWTDDRSTLGTIVPRGEGLFDVIGSFTFAELDGPTRDVIVTLRETGVAEPVQITSTAVGVGDLRLSAFPIEAFAGVEFSGIVAVTSEPIPDADLGEFLATIDWDAEDDQAAGQVATVQRREDGRLAISTSHVFKAPGTYRVRVTLERDLGGEEGGEERAETIATAEVASSRGFAGRLSPLSDSGVSDSDNLTNISQPIFIGTATPLSIVDLFARIPALTDPVPIGQAIASQDGSWSITSRPLLPGFYEILGRETPIDGPGGSLEQLTAVGIDTLAPRVAFLTFNPRTRRILIGFQDEVSGLSRSEILDVRNFNLIGPPLVRSLPRTVSEPLQVRPLPSDPLAVILELPAQTRGAPFPHRLRILSSNIRDLAGNPLDGEFHGRLPSGNGVPGGLFEAPLFRFLGRIPLDSAGLMSARRPIFRVDRRG
ncbi:Ig-like domain-containing protein [Tautonia sp. JC769]|uniref:Ig-like domain-containing protein n=1 Tax=Tautonia sp. JC769 TaxID=3232135 RepID=UPI00345B2979